MRESLRKFLCRRYGSEKARQVAYRMDGPKAGLLTQRLKDKEKRLRALG